MPQDTRIVRAVIHPAIGIARVGNSQREYFIGPVVPYPTPPPPGGYRDPSGALKRQAARFRVYGVNTANEVVRELTLDNAYIRWVVHVANKKAAWYKFELALDIPDAVPCVRRNATYKGANRRGLVIDPGPREVQGRDQSGPRFSTGRFLGRPVYLGELRTDGQGRLLFLGGLGVAGTPFRNNPVRTYANNEGWYDDIADGPVTAEVIVDGERLPVTHAWVVVGPPNYAPDLVTIQTMYDVITDAYQRRWWGPRATPSFTAHILPIFQQLVETQWVNTGFHRLFGPRAPYELLAPGYLAQLARNDPAQAEARQAVFQMFRSPDATNINVRAWPEAYGDAAFVRSKETNPRYLLALTATQYADLRAWAGGNFEADWDPNAPPPPASIEDVPLDQQPTTLDKAALHFCMGGPFHPGCEMTWPMRHTQLYRLAFRVRPREADEPEEDYGDYLTPDRIGQPNGPLAASSPGDITRWLAVPWQTDTASCRSGYEPQFDPYVPTFWPARVPNHVLKEGDYARLMDPDLSDEQRLAAFNIRVSWFRGLGQGYQGQINRMVTSFGKMGLVERRDGPGGDLPGVVYVETGTTLPELAGALRAQSDEEAILAEGLADLSGQDVEKVQHPRRLGELHE